MSKNPNRQHEELVIPDSISGEEYAEHRDWLLNGEFDKIAEFFRGKSDEERKKYVPFAKKWFDLIIKDRPGWRLVGRHMHFLDSDKTFQEVGLAYILSCGGFEEIKKAYAKISIDDHFSETVERFLILRNPPWTGKLLDTIINSNNLFWGEWGGYLRAYRRFLKRRMIEISPLEKWIQVWFVELLRKKKPQKIREYLESEPELLENDFWRIFEVRAFFDAQPFSSNYTYTTCDSDNVLKDAITEMIELGTIPLERVLDACFKALSFDYTDHQEKWFVQLLERIFDKCIDAEKQPDVCRKYLDLLEHREKTPRGLGCKVLESLFKNKGEKFSDTEILDRLSPLLREPAKGRAVKGVNILGKIARKNPGERERCFRLALEAMQHESPDVQGKGLGVLLENGGFESEEIREAVRGISGSMAASVKDRIPKDVLCDSHAENSTVAEKGFREEVFYEMQPERVVPIGSFEELLDSGLSLSENPFDPDEIERFLDGLSRLGAVRDVNFETKTASLLKIVKRKIGASVYEHENRKVFRAEFDPPFSGRTIEQDVIYLLMVWLCGKIPKIEGDILRFGEIEWKLRSPIFEPGPIDSFFSDYVKDISERFLQGEARSLLCAPSYRGGAVDPLDFARRLIDSEKYGHEPSEHEKTLAILRLVPVSKREALESIDAEIENRTEYIEAVRFALGADDFDPVAEGTPQYWFAAARAREPFGDFPHLESLFPYHGPDAAFAAKYEAEKIEQTPKIIGHPYSIKIVPKPYGNPGHFPPTILHARLDDGWRWTFLEHPWKLSIWPLNPDPVFARAIERYSNVPDGAYGRSLTWYLSSFSPFMKDIGKISGMLLLMGLSAKLADIRTVARDTMIRLIGAGNLKIETCIDATVELVSSEAFKRVRWAAEFQILSGVSKRHAVFVRKLLEGIVPSIEPARCGGFLELLLELCISAEENVQSNVTRDYLSSIKGTGKSAKLAKQLLRNR